MSGHVITEACDCEWAKRYPHDRSRGVATYLRELADRCERGEIRHVSVSAHPAPVGEERNHE